MAHFAENSSLLSIHSTNPYIPRVCKFMENIYSRTHVVAKVNVILARVLREYRAALNTDNFENYLQYRIQRALFPIVGSRFSFNPIRFNIDCLKSSKHVKKSSTYEISTRQ